MDETADMANRLRRVVRVSTIFGAFDSPRLQFHPSVELTFRIEWSVIVGILAVWVDSAVLLLLDQLSELVFGYRGAALAGPPVAYQIISIAPLVILASENPLWTILTSFNAVELKQAMSKMDRFVRPFKFIMPEMLAECVLVARPINELHAVLLAKLYQLAEMGNREEWDSQCANYYAEFGLSQSAQLLILTEAVRVQAQYYHGRALSHDIADAVDDDRHLRSTKKLFKMNADTDTLKMQGGLAFAAQTFARVLNADDWEYITSEVKFVSITTSMAQLLAAYLLSSQPGKDPSGLRKVFETMNAHLIPIFDQPKRRRSNPGKPLYRLPPPPFHGPMEFTILTFSSQLLLKRMGDEILRFKTNRNGRRDVNRGRDRDERDRAANVLEIARFLRLIRNETLLSLLITYFGYLFNRALLAKKRPHLRMSLPFGEVFGHESELNHLNILAVQELLDMFFHNALTINPTHAPWLRSAADFRYARGLLNEAGILYLEYLCASRQPLLSAPQDNQSEDLVWRRLRVCLSRQQYFYLAALVCQLIEHKREEEYIKAMELIFSQLSLDAGANYSCMIYDNTLAELLSDIFERNHMEPSADLLYSFAYRSCMNPDGRDVLSREQARRAQRLLRTLAAQFFNVHF